jgi:hypothetical protein
MDTTQLLLSTAVTVTTILLIIVSVQLISLLKQLKKDQGKANMPINKPSETKKEKTTKKRVNLTTLLEKMKNRISHPHTSKRTFFKS